EVRSLLHEALVEAEGEAENRAAVIVDRNPAAARAGEALIARLRAEERFLARTLDPRGSAGELASESMLDGKIASPVAITSWHQPWVPLYLEWKMTVTLETTLRVWRLGELDFEAKAQDPATTVEREMSGRALLSRAGATAIAELLAETIDEEENLSSTDRVLTGAQLERLRELNEVAGNADVLGASLEGFRSALLGITNSVRFTPAGEEGEILP